jgi:hypothetical protein
MIDTFLGLPLPLQVLTVVLAAWAVVALVKGPREAWRLWKRFGHMLGDAVASVVMTLFYFTILVPFAGIARLTQDALGRTHPAEKLWHERVPETVTVEEGRRQF